MELYLNNVGIIKDSNILLNGLTVVTGKNSSGKTTVGKVIYSLLSAGNNLEKAFEESKREYVFSQLVKIENVLRIRRARQMKFMPENKHKSSLDEIMGILAMHRFRNFDADKMISFLIETRNVIHDLTLETYKEYVFDLEDNHSLKSNKYIHALFENFSELQERALFICDKTLEIVQDEHAFYNFIKDRTSAFLNHEFNKQIKPVKYRRNVSRIELKEPGKIIVSAKVKTKNYVEFSENSSFIYPYSRCIFIDNPFVVDALDRYDELFHSAYREFDELDDKSLIKSDDIKDREEILVDLLLNNKISNFFDDLELQKKFKDVFDQINDIVPGEFSKSEDGYYYVNDGARLSVKNMATGSKMFFIIKNLLLNGLIDENTMLILDEPESHLHPEWINKFAQILVLLVSKIHVNILMTTHSPNLMLALNVYAKKMEIIDNSHFYLAETMEDQYFSKIRCIDESIGEGYSHLSLPLVEMNLELNELDGE